MSDPNWTLHRALQEARALGIDRLDAQVLLSELLQQNRAWLLAHDQDALPPEQQQRLQGWLHRRAQGEPVAYILGHKEFFGLTLHVDPAVLIPRPDTEILVEWALEHIPPQQPMSVLDLGTGSGAIALAIQSHRPLCKVTAVDASPTALATAQQNAQRLGLPVRFMQGSWMQPLGDARFDLIVSNPPYVAEQDPHLPALRHEPLSALTAGADGLDDIRHIVAQASRHLHPQGWLLLEHGYDQAPSVSKLLTAHGFRQVATRLDLGGQDRCTGGQTL